MTDTTSIRVLCVDDHPLLREGIGTVIELEPSMRLAGQASTGHEAIERFRQLQPDVTLMDLRLPDMSGIDAIIAIRAECPNARILILSTAEGDVDIQRALEAGARGYLLKSTPPKGLVEAIRQVHLGRTHVPTQVARTLAGHLGEESLTDREVEILSYVAGSRNRDLGERFSISEETVKVHIRNIMRKLGAADRTQAVAIAVRRGIITFSKPSA